MIKEIEIKNFESHEHTKINFSDGVNTIVGRSNSGKSSIIRAMSVVTANKWQKEQIRCGESTSIIKMTTDRGWVECERGEKVNRWKCFDGNEVQEYKSVGINVPEQVQTILGMGEKNRGDFKEMPNFMFQLDKHYMLSEIDGKKATANMIARMMDNAIGLGGMQDLIKELSVDLVKDKKWLTEKQNEIIELKSTIIDDVIFDDYEKNQKMIKDLLTEIQNVDKKIKNAEVYSQQYWNISEKINENRNLISKFPNILECENKQQEIVKISNIIRLYEQMNDVTEKISENKKYASLQIQDMEDKITKIKSIKAKIEDMENILTKSREIWIEMKNVKKENDRISKNTIILEQQIDELKDKMGFCPLCGGKFDHEH